MRENKAPTLSVLRGVRPGDVWEYAGRHIAITAVRRAHGYCEDVACFLNGKQSRTVRLALLLRDGKRVSDGEVAA